MKEGMDTGLDPVLTLIFFIIGLIIDFAGLLKDKMNKSRPPLKSVAQLATLEEEMGGAPGLL